MSETGNNNKAEDKQLYAEREHIIPRATRGKFSALRALAVLVLMGIFYLVPWVNRNGRQVILFDLPDRKFYFFDVVIWPQDLFYLAILLFIAAFALFFFTTLAGRLWCGYACPQTVWTEISIWFDRLTLGDRRAQIKLSKMPWNSEKISKVGLNTLVWILFSLWTGFTFVGWFSPIRGLLVDFMNFAASTTEVFWTLFYAFATWGLAGWLREQVCFYMCPYARFQSVMFDTNTIIISYDYNRGEPRGKLSKGKLVEGNGSCIDCDICVKACPTGIDIREGLQYECIACAACIDACNEVMDKTNQPRGLIRYTTENALEGKDARILRPRSVMYGMVLLAAVASFLYALANRLPLEMNIIRDRGSLYMEDNNGNIKNIYKLKIMNMDNNAHKFKLSVDSEDLRGLKMSSKFENYKVESGEMVEVPLVLTVGPESIKKRANEVLLTLKAQDDSGLEIREPARFLGPVFR